MTNFKTISILDNNSTQLIIDNTVTNANNSSLTTLGALVANILTFKPVELVDTGYRSILINNDSVVYLGSPNNNSRGIRFTVPLSSISETAIDNFIADVLSNAIPS